MSITTTEPTIDVRSIMPGQRHALIFDRFDAVAPGESLQIVNDHDPKGLHIQFDQYLSGKYEWEYLENGPGLWRVRITKLEATTEQAVQPQGSCCSGGACCG